MNFWELITGSDMTKEMKGFDTRIKELPQDYQAAWEEIKESISEHSDFTGRNLMPIFADAVDLLEESAADGQSVHEALGDDIKGFSRALCGEEGAKTYRDKWRDQLNTTVAKKLADLNDKELS